MKTNPNLNRGTACGTEPVSVRAKYEGIDGLCVRESVEMSAFVQIPEHSLSVSTSRSTQRSVRGHGDRVQVLSMSIVISLQLAVGQTPHLDDLVPASRHNQGSASVGGEANARHPVGVSIILVGKAKLHQPFRRNIERITILQ